MSHVFSDHVLLEKPETSGNFVLAILAGLTAAGFGTVAWTATSLATGWHVGLLALAIGALVGICIRSSGGGSHFIYGILGVAFTVASCLVGEMGVALFSSMSSVFDLYGVATHVDLGLLAASIINKVSPMMGVIYAISAFEAYMLSIRK